MPIVTVEQSPRPLDEKRKLVAGITEAFVADYGVEPEHVQFFIHQVGHENWAKGGDSPSTADSALAPITPQPATQHALVEAHPPPPTSSRTGPTRAAGRPVGRTAR